MERAVAIRKLGKLLGKKFGYQINKHALEPSDREALKPELAAAQAHQKDLRERQSAIYKKLLDDPEYKEITEQCNRASKRVDELSWKCRQQKITVGTSNSMFFHVAAEGDSWEEIIAAVTAKKAKGQIL